MAEGSSNTSSGTPFLTLLSVLFIGLKLTGYVDWPWVWVLAPIWGQLVLFLVMLFFALVCLAVAALVDRLR